MNFFYSQSSASENEDDDVYKEVKIDNEMLIDERESDIGDRSELPVKPENFVTELYSSVEAIDKANQPMTHIEVQVSYFYLFLSLLFI